MLTVGFVYVFCILLGIFLWGIQPRKRPKNYPPGPRRFGLLGSFPNFVLKNEFNFMTVATRNFTSEYLKVVAFDIGPMPLIMVNDPQVLKEAFAKPALFGRPPFPPAQLFKEARGFAMRSDDHAKEIQKFTINQLKNLGLGKQSLEPMMLDEANELVETLRKRAGTPLSTQCFFNISALNVLWQIVTGERLSLDNHKAHKFLSCMLSLSQSWLKMLLCMGAPKLYHWIPFLYDDVKEGQTIGRELFMDIIQSRRLNFKPEELNDFIHAYIEKVHSTTDKSSAFYGEIAYENLAGTLTELLIGALETSGISLSWICLFLALHPEKQEKLQREIDMVLEGRMPTLQDRIRLPYLEAVIYESLRKASPLPFGVHRITIEDTTIGGYDVPKDTLVIANIYAIHYCPNFWDDPESFKPERFLSSDEKTSVKQEAFCAFSFGKKRCPGEQLAKDSLLMITARLFREFTVTLNPHEAPPKLDKANRNLKAVFNPPPHTLIFTERNPKMYNFNQSTTTYF